MKLTSRIPSRYILLLFVALSVHAVFCLSLYYHFLNPLFYISTHSKGQGSCFFGIYQSGVNLTNGESIYGCDNYQKPSRLVVPSYHHYRYLPFTSYVSSIVSRIAGPWQAYWIWIAVNEILLAACIIMTLKLRRSYGLPAVAASALWLLFSPFYVELYMGQFCFTMTFFIFLLLYPYLKKEASETSRQHMTNDAPASGWSFSVSWILSVLIKSFTVLYSVPLMKMGKKKLAFAGIAVALATSLPYFLLRPQDFKWFLNLNFRPLPAYTAGGYFGFSTLLKEFGKVIMGGGGNSSLNMGLFDITASNIPIILFLGSITGLTFYITIMKKKIDPLGSIALWTLTFFLVFKDIWEYHYVMLLPFFVGYYLRTGSKYLLLLFMLIAVPTPFFFYDIPSATDPQAYWSAPLIILHHSFKAIPTLLFYFWIVRREMKGLLSLQEAFSFKRS